ncbi:hypothetical protein AURDEDRAFT_177186 [Auricularia subglabra TFB-10046 SS5]|uniref:Uncharacterized protein n=1 Tax=Auricularia subglabra (strain TFB-10046 / SS5) TaxID=717982 RepID=J0WMZ7_AURST|nr:hypothetical protein AURDEDRAFT_177186 [Auricularia subglabra TFB-10046 SS5]
MQTTTLEAAAELKNAIHATAQLDVDALCSSLPTRASSPPSAPAFDDVFRVAGPLLVEAVMSSVLAPAPAPVPRLATIDLFDVGPASAPAFAIVEEPVGQINPHAVHEAVTETLAGDHLFTKVHILYARPLRDGRLVRREVRAWRRIACFASVPPRRTQPCARSAAVQLASLHIGVHALRLSILPSVPGRGDRRLIRVWLATTRAPSAGRCSPGATLLPVWPRAPRALKNAVRIVELDFLLDALGAGRCAFVYELRLDTLADDVFTPVLDRLHACAGLRTLRLAAPGARVARQMADVCTGLAL